MTKNKDLSAYNKDYILSASDYKFGIVVSEWNPEITEALKEGALETLIKHGAKHENIITKYVPGSFELTKGAKLFIDNSFVDAIICLGCVIQGETRHFDFICQGVSNGITQLNIQENTPVIFGLLTTENYQQAKERAGGKHGNKGVEAAVTAIKMVALAESF